MMRVNAHAGDRTAEVDHVVGLDAAGGSHGLSTSSGVVRALPQALGYVRVSTQGQFDEQHLARQIEKVLAHAKRRGLEITLIFQEVVHGALTSQEDRPALHNCLDEALARGCQIVATSPSRLTRSSAHAHQLYDQHPDRFDFVEPLNGYADKPWHLEVADCHASFPDHTSTGTIMAMDKSRAAGKKYGAGDGGVAGRAAADKVIKANKQARVERMADILAGHPSWQTLTRAEAGKLFSDAGVHPPHSSISSSVPWTKGTITRPFRAAKELLAARNHIVQTIPPTESCQRRCATFWRCAAAYVTRGRELTSNLCHGRSRSAVFASGKSAKHGAIRQQSWGGNRSGQRWTPSKHAQRNRLSGRCEGR